MEKSLQIAFGSESLVRSQVCALILCSNCLAENTGINIKHQLFASYVILIGL